MRPVMAPLLALVFAGAALSGHATEFRSRRAIATPPAAGVARPAPQGNFKPVDPRIVRAAVEKIYATYTYNNGKLQDFFDSTFNDRSRVMDNIATQIPRDAKLRVLGLESIQTLEQTEGRIPTRVDRFRESRVAVVVRGQIEFHEPQLGFVRRVGTSEFILKVYERIP